MFLFCNEGMYGVIRGVRLGFCWIRILPDVAFRSSSVINNLLTIGIRRWITLPSLNWDTICFPVLSSLVGEAPLLWMSSIALPVTPGPGFMGVIVVSCIGHVFLLSSSGGLILDFCFPPMHWCTRHGSVSEVCFVIALSMTLPSSALFLIVNSFTLDETAVFLVMRFRGICKFLKH